MTTCSTKKTTCFRKYVVEHTLLSYVTYIQTSCLIVEYHKTVAMPRLEDYVRDARVLSLFRLSDPPIVTVEQLLMTNISEGQTRNGLRPEDVERVITEAVRGCAAQPTICLPSATRRCISSGYHGYGTYFGLALCVHLSRNIVSSPSQAWMIYLGAGFTQKRYQRFSAKACRENRGYG